MGRPKKYFSEEERKKANTANKTKYMMNKEWKCPVCGDHDYKLAGKSNHIKSKKHIKNAKVIIIKKQLELLKNRKIY